MNDILTMFNQSLGKFLVLNELQKTLKLDMSVMPDVEMKPVSSLTQNLINDES